MAKSNHKNTTILVVEDNKLVADEAVRVLTEAGHAVLFAPDGEIALEICKTQPVDLVLLDIVLPKMTGLECYDQLKRLNPALKLILTSFAPPPASFQSMNPDFNFIEKTNDSRKLPKQISEILNKS